MNSSLREMNHGIFSLVQLIIVNPSGDGLIELLVETGLQLLTHLPPNIQRPFHFSLECNFISGGIFVFRSCVFQHPTGGGDVCSGSPK